MSSNWSEPIKQSLVAAVAVFLGGGIGCRHYVDVKVVCCQSKNLQ